MRIVHPSASFVVGIRGILSPIASVWHRVREALAAVLLGESASSQPTGCRLSRPTRITIGALALAVAAAGALAPGTIGSASVALLTVVFCTLFAGWPLGMAAWLLSNALALLLMPAPLRPTEAMPFAFVAVIGLITMLLALLARTELRRARVANARLFQLATAGSETVFVTDGQGRLLESYGGRSTPFDWRTIRGRGWLRTLHQEDRQRFADLSRADDGLLEFDARFRPDDGAEWRWHRLRATPRRDRKGDVAEWVGTVRDVHDRKRDSERRDLALSESRHRLKNLIAIIEALAKYSGARIGAEPVLDAFIRRFSGRLHALAAAGDLLLARSGTALEAGEVIRATLEPFLIGSPHRFSFDGPEVELSEHLGGALGLAVHELATNALKYGALSVPSGSVSVTWNLKPTPEGDAFTFTWLERGGPMPVPPAREGFGTRLIRTVAAREKHGSVTIDYAPEGLVCRIACVRERAA
jgi:two-component sensor histidine kinase